MNRKTLTLLTLFTALLPFVAQAHEGHGVGHGQELGHYLLSSEHAVPVAMVVALTVVFLAIRSWKKQTSE